MKIDIIEIQNKLSLRKRNVTIASGAKKSAVLIPIVKRENGFTLLFTKRTEDVEHHKGQISFPGGATDSADKNIIETALREADEEIGLKKEFVKIIGMLDEVHTPSDFHITPVVGFIENLPVLKRNENEVLEIFEIDLNNFFDEKIIRTELREVFGKTRTVYFYDVWREPIWGATAYFVKQLVDIINSQN